jgi:hypothetical protein
MSNVNVITLPNLGSDFDIGTRITSKVNLATNIALSGVPTAATAAVNTSTTQLATTAFVTGQAGSASPLIDGTATVGVSLLYSRQDHIHPTDTTRAALLSPTFTGTPSAPTAATNTSTTQLATTAFVTGQAATVAPVIDGVATVGASLLYARQDHIHPTDTTRAPTASPTFTGTSTFPGSTVINSSGNIGIGLTPTALLHIAAGTASTPALKFATGVVLTTPQVGAMEFDGTNLYFSPTTSRKIISLFDRITVADSAYTVTATDNNIQYTTITAARIVTLPAASAIAAGRWLSIGDASGSCSGTNTITITRAGTDTIAGATTYVINTAYGQVNIQSDGVGKWVIESGSQFVAPATLSSYALLASPAFTGTPTAPTASAGNNSTQLATTAYVDVGLALKSNIASPTFTGIPLAPTAAVNTSTTQLATTQFVLGQAATVPPLIDGTATIGTSLLYARQDHIHPTDTTRSPVASPTFTGTVTMPAGTTTIAPLKLTSGVSLTTATAGTVEYDGTNLYFTPVTTRRTVAFLDSPAFSGVPTAPTAAGSTNNTQIATTQFVTSAVATAVPIAATSAQIQAGTNNTAFMNPLQFATAAGAGLSYRIVVSNSYIAAFGTGGIASNMAFGQNALLSNTSGSTNAAVGNGALQSNTTGNANTAIGYLPLYNNTIGLANTAVGLETLYTNTTGSNNTALGYAALLYSSTASNNTAVGYCALYTNTTGYSNSAFGVNALQGNTTGYYNVAVGQSSLQLNTTGAQNTAIGHYSLYSNNGDNNVAVGYVALNSNTSGQNNTAVGQSALTANTTGNNNTGVGTQALTSNTSGVQNTSVGVYSLSSNTTGVNNAALGFGALITNTVGDNNTAVGFYALRFNSTGYQNVAVGMSALLNNTTATNNVAMGYISLYTNTTGVNNVALGAYALYFNSTSHNNIGVGVQALYNNTTGSPNIGIGTLSLYANTTGTQNIAIGLNSLYSTTSSDNCAVGVNTLFTNTTGSQNIAIGTQSLYYNTTGSNNVALGYKAVYVNTTGINLVGIGAYSLYSNTTGGQNVSVGMYSLYSNTSGIYNTGLGYQSLYSNTIGSQNTAVGVSSLISLTTGLYNTAIGYNTGSGISTGNYNTILGASFAGLSASLANTILIGNGDGVVRADFGFTTASSWTFSSPVAVTGILTAPTAAANTNTTQVATTAYVDTGLALKISTSQLGVASGVATLDGSGKLTSSQLPASVVGGLNYQGTWNASTNTPTLTAGTGTKGYYYKVSVAGSTTLTPLAPDTWYVGDMVAYDGTAWDKIDGPAEAVTTVAGRIGAIVLAVADVSGAAPLVSPTFTGTPFAPTAAINTSTTQIATTQFVVGQVGTASPLINGSVAVGTSLLYSRQDHVHPTDTTRAPTVSPTFTGSPVINADLVINTTDSYNMLRIFGSTKSIRFGANATYAVIEALDNTYALYKPLWIGGSELRVGLSGVEVARFDTSGNLLLGVTSGSHLLEVNGTGNFVGVLTAPTAAVNTNTTQVATTQFVIGQASTVAPSINGTATVGTSLLYARQDHIHPTDTTRAPTVNPTFTGTATFPGSVLNANGIGIGISPGTIFALDVVGNTRSNGSNVYGLTRTLPSVVGTEVDIGSFALSNGAGCLWVSVIGQAASYSVAKEYTIPVGYSLTGGVWNIVLPISSTGIFGGVADFTLEAMVNLGTVSLRLRSLTTTPASASITIRHEGVNTDGFTASTATAAVSAPTIYYPTSMLTQSGGGVGIGLVAPTALLHVGAGTATFTAFKLSTGVILTTPVSGSVEWDGTSLYITNTARQTLAYLASPAFTGVPTAPTAAGGTNNTQIATTQFVTSAAGAYLPLTGGALTGYLGVNGSGTSGPFQVKVATDRVIRIVDNGSSAELDATNLAQNAYVNLVIGATNISLVPNAGTVTAPTAAANTATTQLATTAFVMNQYATAGTFTALQIFQASVSNTAVLYAKDSVAGASIFIVPKLGTGGYNSISQAADIGLFFTGGSIDTGALVLAPWASTGVGLRMTNTGLTTLSGINSALTLSANSPTLVLNKTNGNSAVIYGQTGGLTRWQVILGNSASEGGSNAGGDFGISRFNDAGTGIDTPFYITRSSGDITTKSLYSTGFLQVTNGSDNDHTFFVVGATKGVRIGTSTGYGAIEGVQNNLGTYQPLWVGGSQLLFSVSGIEKARFDTSGNLCIGVTSGTHKLEVVGTANISAGLSVGGGITTQDGGYTNALVCGSLTANTGSTSTGSQYLYFVGYTGGSVRYGYINSDQYGNMFLTPSSGAFVYLSATPGAGANDTRIATTAFVQSAVGSYLPLTGGTITGSLTANASVVVNATSGTYFQVSNPSDNDHAIFLSGATKGIRIGTNSTGGVIEGVQNNLASYQPLYVGGSYLAVTISGVEKARFDSVGATFNYLVSLNYATPIMNFNKTANGQYQGIFGNLNGVNRWFVNIGNANSETGTGNTGSDFALHAYSDTGVFLGQPLTIYRGTSVAVFSASPQIPTVATSDNSVNAASTAYVKAVVASYLPLTGGTITGNLAVSAGVNTYFSIIKNTGTGTASILGNTNGSTRWEIQLGNGGVAESGSNTGSDFAINRFSDAAAFLGSAIVISRASGNITLNGAVFATTLGAGTSNTQVATTQFVQTAVSGYLPLTSGTLTNTLFVSTTNNALFVLNKSATGNNTSAIYGQRNGLTRWWMELGNGDAETGSGNTGSSFYLSRYNDAGTRIDSPIYIDRSTGNISTTALYANNFLQVINTSDGDHTLFVVGSARGVRVGTSATTGVIEGVQNNNATYQPLYVGGSYVGFSISGVEKARFDTSGNFCLGVASGSHKLEVVGDGNFNGNLTSQYLGVATGSPYVVLNKTTGASGQNAILGQTAGISRWQIRLGDGNPEGTGNAGSDFYIDSFADSGAYLTSPIVIARSSGNITLNGSVFATTLTAGTNNTQLATTQFVQTAVAGYLPLGGGTITGNLYVSNGYPTIILNKSSGGAIANQLQGNTANVPRWLIQPGNAASESTPGTNIGSDFAVHRYDDTGGYLGQVININRASGLMTLSNTPVFPTMAAGNNSTYGATTQFVATNFAPLVNPVFTGMLQVPYLKVGGGSANLGGASYATINSVFATLANSGCVGVGWNYAGGPGEIDLFLSKNGGSTGGLKMWDFPATSGAITKLWEVDGTGNTYNPGTAQTGGRIFSGGAGSGGIWVDGGSQQFVGSLGSTQMGMYNNGTWVVTVDNTGHAYAPTATYGDNSTQISTTAFVYNALAKRIVFDSDFGTVGNGTTDDTTALTNFWNHAIANPGVEHRLRPLVFKVTAALPDINVAGVIIKGSGSDIHGGSSTSYLSGTILKYVGGTITSLVKITAVTSGLVLTNVQFTGIGIDCASAVTYGVYCLSITDCVIDVAVVEARSAGINLEVVATLASGEARDNQRNKISISSRQIDTSTNSGISASGSAMICNGDSIANTSLNEFWVNCLHYNGAAVNCINSDTNIWWVRIYCANYASTADGMSFRGNASANSTSFCRDEIVRFYTASMSDIPGTPPTAQPGRPIKIYGGTTYPSGTYSTGHDIQYLDVGNGTPAAVLEAGGSCIQPHQCTGLVAQSVVRWSLDQSTACFAPTADNLFDLGLATSRIKNLFASSIFATVFGNVPNADTSLSANGTGNIYFGLNSASRWVMQASTFDFVPIAANSYSIGNSTYTIANLYAGGVINTNYRFTLGGSAFAERSSPATSGSIYNELYSADGYNIAIYLGGGTTGYTDPTNYYRNTGHVFGSIGQAAVYLTLDATGQFLPATPATTNSSLQIATTAFVHSVAETAWTSYTPTITVSSGALTTYSATGSYLVRGKICFVCYQLYITTNGTAAGTIGFSLPSTLASTVGSTFSGRERGVSGNMIQGYADASTNSLYVFTYNNLYAGGSGYIINISGFYPVA